MPATPSLLKMSFRFRAMCTSLQYYKFNAALFTACFIANIHNSRRNGTKLSVCVVATVKFFIAPPFAVALVNVAEHVFEQ